MAEKLVYVGVLHHKHGNDVFVGWTEAQVYHGVYAYVKEWWDDFCSDQPLPKKHIDAIEAYFEAAGDYEWLEILTDTLPV
jgi:hypothetical protein